MKLTPMLTLAAVLATGSLPAFAGWSDGTFGGLQAKIYTPSKPASGRMLFVNLHGCAQKNTDLQKSNWDQIAENFNAVVILPAVGQSTLVGCWNYGNSSINMTDYAAVVNGTKSAIANTQYGIDPNQVYITGISSGATFAAAVGCGNPDIYAGVGPAAGPTIGSNQMNAMSGETPSVSKAVNWCRSQATSSKTPYYTTQLYAQAYGADPAAGDGVIGKGFIPPNREVQLQLYGLTGGATYAQDIKYSNTAGHTNTAETEYSVNDAKGAKRASLIVVPGMGHAWPSGVPTSGSVGSYVSNKFDFGTWMAVNFTANNCRMAANQGKSICGGTPTTTTTTTTTTGTGPSTTTTTTTTTAPSTTTTTTTTTTTAGACFKASNYAHVTAGRAYNSMGYAKANGSNQSMGLYNTFTTTKLRQTGTNYYVIDSTCP